MMTHVSYDTTAEGRFDGDCPPSHPIKLPEIHWYFRILNYPGGQHTFSDGSDVLHADYFSGWDAAELQRVLDECSNESDAASPDAFCEGDLTFRDGPKNGQKPDDDILAALRALQPATPLDLRATVAPEPITDLATLPRGACFPPGGLIERTPPSPPPPTGLCTVDADCTAPAPFCRRTFSGPPYRHCLPAAAEGEHCPPWPPDFQRPCASGLDCALQAAPPGAPPPPPDGAVYVCHGRPPPSPAPAIPSPPPPSSLPPPPPPPPPPCPPPPSPSPPSPSEPLGCFAPPSCPLSATQRSQRCSCQYEWGDGAASSCPVATRLHCHS